MLDENLIKKQLKNAKGKRLLEKTKLEYSKEIITELEKNPSLLDKILTDLELTEIEFFSYISGEKNANITLYDQALTLTKIKPKK